MDTCSLTTVFESEDGGRTKLKVSMEETISTSDSREIYDLNSSIEKLVWEDVVIHFPREAQRFCRENSFKICVKENYSTDLL